MAKNKLVLNDKGVSDLLKSAELAQVCQLHAEATRGNAEAASGGTYGTRQAVTDRVGYTVFPADKIARQDNLDNNTLIKSVT